MKKIILGSIFISSLLFGANVDNGTSSTEFIGNSDNNNISGYGENKIIGSNNQILTGGGNIVYGSINTISGTNNISIGHNNTVDNTTSSNGGNYPNFRTSNVAIGYLTTATGQGSIAIGTESKATEDFTVSFGDVGSERKIVNVRAGVNDTDGVNVSQLNQTLQSSIDYTDLVFSSVSAGVSEAIIDDKDEQVLSKANSYTDSKISALEESLTKEYRSATATAIALGVSPILSNGNKSAIGIGMGHYEGENAVAVNYVGEVNKNVHVQLGTALNSNSQSFKGGVSFGF